MNFFVLKEFEILHSNHVHCHQPEEWMSLKRISQKKKFSPSLLFVSPLQKSQEALLKLCFPFSFSFILFFFHLLLFLWSFFVVLCFSFLALLSFYFYFKNESNTWNTCLVCYVPVWEKKENTKREQKRREHEKKGTEYMKKRTKKERKKEKKTRKEQRKKGKWVEYLKRSFQSVLFQFEFLKEIPLLIKKS